MPMMAIGVSHFLTELGILALRSLVLGGLARITLWAFRMRAPSVRLFVWTTVLYGSLVLPVLAWILPPVVAPVPSVLRPATAERFQTPTRAAQQVATPNRSKRVRGISSQEEIKAATQVLLDLQAARSLPGYARSFAWWGLVATWTYWTVSLILLVRIAIAQFLGSRLLRQARRIGEDRVHSRLNIAAGSLRLLHLPEIAESEVVSVPITMGVLRPTIVFPANWRSWSVPKLDAVIAHELSHVARRDALTQRVALLYRAIFWFSPFAWWLNRHLAELAEQASDESVLSRGLDHNVYARTLLGFFEALRVAPGRVWWQGVAMATSGQVEQRMERILAWRGAVPMSLKKSVAVAIVVFAIPVVYVTASLQAAEPSSIAQQPASPSAAAKPTPAPSAPSIAPVGAASAPAVAPVAPGPGGGVAAVAPVAPVLAGGVPGVGPVAPAALANAFQADSFAHHGDSYSYGSDDEQRFVIVTGNSDSVTMSGSSQDVRHAKKLKQTIPGDFIWFQRDERSYVIRDQATVARAKKLWAPQEELGKKQEALGKQQEALGKKQEAIGKRMEAVRVQVPDMTAQLDKLRAEMKALSSGATQEQIGNLQSEIGELQSKIGEIQSHAGDQQSKLGEEMGALGEQQGKLGEEQGELGRQQGELAEKATREMKEILDEAIKNGTAQPEPDSRGDGASL